MSPLPMSKLFPGRQEPDGMVYIVLLSPEMLHLLHFPLCAPWENGKAGHLGGQSAQGSSVQMLFGLLG